MPQPRKYAIMPQGTGWRKELADRKEQWTNRNLDEIHQSIEDYVYLEALNATKLSNLAKEFGVTRAEFEATYGDVWRLGNGQLESHIAKDTLEYGLKSQIPVAKIWLGKSLGNLGESKSVDVQSEVDDENITFNVKIARRKDDADESDS